MNTQLTVPVTDLSHQVGEPYTFARDVAAPADIAVPLIGVPEGDPIRLDLQLFPLDEGILVQGSVRTTAVGQCSRCLREVRLQMDEELADLVFYPERQAELVADGDEEAADMPVVVDERVDIEPLLRDALVLAMPLSPLCRPDCQGLCPECGERWDELPGDHAHEFLDPRFSALDALAEQLREQGDGEGAAGGVTSTTTADAAVDSETQSGVGDDSGVDTSEGEAGERRA